MNATLFLVRAASSFGLMPIGARLEKFCLAHCCASALARATNCLLKASAASSFSRNLE
jgi:hypothetical protein